MYAYQNNILSIPARLLYDDWELISYNSYLKHCQRGKLVRTKEGKGEGNEAYVAYHNLPEEIKELCIQELGPPNAPRNQLEDLIQPDPAAVQFYANHRTPKNQALPAKKQREKVTNVMILNAIKTVFKTKSISGRITDKHWQNISEAVNTLNTKKWHFKLPTNHRSLHRRYKEYIKIGYAAFIHKGEGTVNSLKIKNDVGDYLLAQYCLPIKLTIPEVFERYDFERTRHDKWPELSRSSIYNYLYQPEKKRIWTFARHGSEAYKRTFQHSITRNKSDWYPNVYWAIDGTKLDWIHIWEDSSNGLGAKLKINVMFDVFSEKIIGWALSFTESHVEHFKAIKMAVNTSECRPYYLTYDNQGGHKMERMQTLYSSLVATNGGLHHSHKTKAHNSPAEQLFDRIQQQVINKFWWSDGQSITVKRDDHKMNTEFVLANKDSIKTVDELYQAWEAAVNIWNGKKHPHFEATRNQVYQHEMPSKEKLDLFDIMDKMWIDQKKKPIKYKAHGLDFRLGDETYQYEVYDADGKIDIEFRRKYVGMKFIVRYDPEFLDGYIQLCLPDENGDIIHIANAEPKRKHQVVPILMKEGDKEQWAEDYKVRDLEFERDLAAYHALMHRTGITPQQEMEDQELLIKCKGDMDKFQRSKIESEENLTSAAARL